MIFLRFLAFLTGAMILMVPPLAMSDMSTGDLAGWWVARALFGLSVVAGSYFFIGFFGPRMRRSWLLRIVGGILLSIPAGGGLMLLVTRSEATILYASGLLMGSAILLFITFVFPATADRRQRPMRAREPRLHQG